MLKTIFTELPRELEHYTTSNEEHSESENNISQLVDSIINMPRRERIRACKEMNATVDYFEER